MCLSRLKSQSLALGCLPILCLLAGNIGANDEVTWPVGADLVYNDGDLAHVMHESGDVSIWNTKDDLYIKIVPDDGLLLKEVAIHIVDDPADFGAVIDKKGQPRVSRFDYRTDYLGDFGVRAEEHTEVIPLSEFEICWGMNPDTCPPNRYMIVAAELQWSEIVESADGFFEEVWFSVPETSFARNDGVFDRFPRSDTEDLGDWAYFVTYRFGKVEPGHFVDANVNGLAYTTLTQNGITGQNGQFWYLPNEYVGFSVGNLPLGEAVGDRAISPEDLFEGADLDDDRTINVARLLQSLDGDGNPTQGSINITAAAVDCLNGVLGDFEPLPPPDEFFADDAAVGALIDATIAACAGAVDLVCNHCGVRRRGRPGRRHQRAGSGKPQCRYEGRQPHEEERLQDPGDEE
jgi:hypothetical protein